jgi:hypothetical protein
MKTNVMESQIFYPLQTLKIFDDLKEEKSFLVSSIHCWVCQYQYMTFLKCYFDEKIPDLYHIILKVPNTAISQTPILWSGEHKVEIPFTKSHTPKIYTVQATVYKQEPGGVTNTISTDGSIIMD